jgi:drug/metabolite transporter (DMT)-like permease
VVISGGGRHPGSGLLFCAIAASGFSTIGILAKLAYAAHVNIVTLLAGRFLLTAAILWLLVVLAGQSIPRGRPLAAGLALGVIGFGAQVTLLFLSLERIDAALSSLLFYSYPAMVTGGALLAGREETTARRLSALTLALAGIVLVFSGAGGSHRDAVGVLLSLASAVLYALIILAADTLTQRASPLAVSAVVSTGAALTFLLGGMALGSLQLGLGTRAFGTIVGIAVATALPLAAFYRGIATVGPATASILLTMEPALTVVLAGIVLDERLGIVQLVGGALVLSAVIILQIRGSEHSTYGTPPR